MEFARFDGLVREARANLAGRSYPDGFEPFEALRATDADLRRVENELNIELPEKYKQFMQRYGGGVFLFLELLPAIAEGEHVDDLLSVNHEMRDSGFVAVAPVGSGDWWGFALAGAECGESVGLWVHDERRVDASSGDFLDFVARRGLRVEE